MMGDFPAADYRTAAAVLDSLNPSPNTGIAVLRDDFIRKADMLEARERYALQLHELACVTNHDAGLLRGAKFLQKLLDDGWTPPEGLF